MKFVDDDDDDTMLMSAPRTQQKSWLRLCLGIIIPSSLCKLAIFATFGDSTVYKFCISSE